MDVGTYPTFFERSVNFRICVPMYYTYKRVVALLPSMRKGVEYVIDIAILIGLTLAKHRSDTS